MQRSPRKIPAYLKALDIAKRCREPLARVEAKSLEELTSRGIPFLLAFWGVGEQTINELNIALRDRGLPEMNWSCDACCYETHNCQCEKAKEFARVISGAADCSCKEPYEGPKGTRKGCVFCRSFWFLAQAPGLSGIDHLQAPTT